jgi:hypothetical protein
MASFVLNQPQTKNTDFESLINLEKDMCNKVFRLVESMMYTATKASKVAYNENLFSDTVSEIAKLAVRINESNVKEKK